MKNNFRHMGVICTMNYVWRLIHNKQRDLCSNIPTKSHPKLMRPNHNRLTTKSFCHSAMTKPGKNLRKLKTASKPPVSSHFPVCSRWKSDPLRWSHSPCFRRCDYRRITSCSGRWQGCICWWQRVHYYFRCWQGPNHAGRIRCTRWQYAW